MIVTLSAGGRMYVFTLPMVLSDLFVVAVDIGMVRRMVNTAGLKIVTDTVANVT